MQLLLVKYSLQMVTLILLLFFQLSANAVPVPDITVCPANARYVAVYWNHAVPVNPTYHMYTDPYTFWGDSNNPIIQISATSYANNCVVVPPTLPAKGMTWKKNNTSTISGVIDVGCGGGTDACNPYQGDTECTHSLPLLCMNKDIIHLKPSWVSSPQYHRWSGGLIATTLPVAPYYEPLLNQSITEANQYCANQFGTGWRVAEFHDGWAWNFKAYGNVGTNVDRFWVYIDDKPANCWSH